MKDYYWIGHIIILLLIGGRLVLSYIQHFQARKDQKEAKKAAEQAQRINAYVQAKERQKAAPPPAPKPPVNTIPPQISGKVVASHYDNVVFRPSVGAENQLLKNEPVHFADYNGTMCLLQRNQLIGSLAENAVTGKIRDWLKSGSMAMGFVTAFPSNISSAKISVYFYRNL